MNGPPVRRVCLVSGGHPSSNPRLVKEADALAGAGYDVTVVHSQSWRPGLEADAALLAKRAWKVHAGWDGSGTGSYRIRRLAQSLGTRLHRHLSVAGLAWAQSPLHRPLLERALAVEADLYLGHTLVALPVVAACARARGARYAFDVEDFHPGEREGSAPGDADWEIADRLLAAHLPGAAFVTASSPLIAREVETRYGVTANTVLNVFDPVQDDGAALAPAWKPGEPLRFYWFSQTIGPGRGLEFILRVLGRLGLPASLDLRGTCSPDYRSALLELGEEAGEGRLTLTFLPTAPADDMVRLARGYTAGISSEVASCLNKDLCLGNKIFTYLAAGTPMFMTPTRAQSNMARALGDAAYLIDPVHEEDSVRLLEWVHTRSRVSQEVQAEYSWARMQASWFPFIDGSQSLPG